MTKFVTEQTGGGRREDTAGTLQAAGGQHGAQLASLPANCVRALAVARAASGPADSTMIFQLIIERQYYYYTFIGRLLLHLLFII